MKSYTKENVEAITLAAISSHNKSIFSVARQNVDEVYQWIEELQNSDEWQKIPYHAQRFLLEGFNGILNHIRPTTEEIEIFNDFQGD